MHIIKMHLILVDELDAYENVMVDRSEIRNVLNAWEEDRVLTRLNGKRN